MLIPEVSRFRNVLEVSWERLVLAAIFWRSVSFLEEE
jgi:hypothetical protein